MIRLASFHNIFPKKRKNRKLVNINKNTTQVYIQKSKKVAEYLKYIKK